jgi:peptide/nickel transport system permease protein
MRGYILRRLLTAIPVIFLVSMLTFIGQKLLPGDPLLAIIGADQESGLTAADLKGLRHDYGLDQPIFVQYAKYLNKAAHGDFGKSFRTKLPVTDTIRQRLSVSVKLASITFVIHIVLAVTLGIIAALYAGTIIDLLATGWAVLGVATPGFWLAIILIILFSVKLNWLPASGWVDPFVHPVDGIKHLVMPVIALEIFGSATIMRQTRSALLEALRQDYVTTARAKRLPERVVIVRHALKNGMLPIMTLLGLSLAGLIGGSVLIERVFAIPGVGRLALDSTQNRDYPVVEGIVLMSATAIVLANLFTDIMYAWLDPRIRYS